MSMTPIDYAPSRAVLDEVLDALAEGDAYGTVIPAEARVRAFDRFSRFGAEKPPLPPRWRHDYRRLVIEDAVWSSNVRVVPAIPASLVPAPRGDEAAGETDAPALATENAAGIVHLASTYLQPEKPAADKFVLSSLAEAARKGGAQVLARLGRIVPFANDRFAALGTAFQNCGAYLEVPDDVHVAAPVQIVWASAPGAPQAVFPKTLIRVGAGATVTVVERHTAGPEALVCGTVEVELGEGARCDYVVVQEADDGARLFFSRGSAGEAGSQMAWHLAELGGALSRTIVEAYLGDEGASADIDAFFFGLGFAHYDLLTRLDHDAAGTRSKTIVRTAAKDRAQGRFTGAIHIGPEAHGADATMRDDALVLSRDAYLDAVPALEIETNDVSAAHAATVGTLDEEELFYVQSRGIARGRAERMIALAFFEPAIAGFPSESLRDEVRTALDHRLDEVGETFET